MADRRSLTADEHRARHVELHRALDELLACFLENHFREARGLVPEIGPESVRLYLPSNVTVQDLMTWSHRQTQRHGPATHRDPTVTFWCVSCGKEIEVTGVTCGECVKRQEGGA